MSQEKSFLSPIAGSSLVQNIINSLTDARLSGQLKNETESRAGHWWRHGFFNK